MEILEQTPRQREAILRNKTGDTDPLGLLKRYLENKEVGPRSEKGRTRKSTWCPGCQLTREEKALPTWPIVSADHTFCEYGGPPCPEIYTEAQHGQAVRAKVSYHESFTLYQPLSAGQGAPE